MNIMYGGTKEEMERLVKDAAKIDKSFKYNTKTVVKNKKAVTELDMSYADIVRAIHIVQTNMGITGTTAEEASKTISGSINMLKAAWSNLVTGMGEGDEKKLDKLVDDVVDAAKTALNNVLPVAEKALYGILHLVEASVPVFARELPGLISRLLPTVVKAAGALLVGLAQALPALLTSVLNAIRTKVVPQIAEVLGGIVGAGKNSSLVNHLTKNIQRVWKDISGILKSIGDGAKKFWSGTLQPVLRKILNFFTKKVLLGIHNGIIKLRPVIEQITPIIKKVSDFVSSVWNNTLFPIMNDALKFFTESSFPAILHWLQDKIIPLVGSVVDTVINLWNTKLEPVVMTIWETIVNKVGPAIIDIIGSVIDFFVDLWDKVQNQQWGEIGSMIWNGIKAGFNVVSGWLLKLILGDDWTPESGWGDAGAKIWGAIKDGFKVVNGWLLKLVLGKDYTPESGWGDAGKKIWAAIRYGFNVVSDWLLKLVLGDEWTPESGWGDAGSKIWGAIKAGFGELNEWLLKLLLGDEYTPESGWGEAGAKIWEAIKTGFGVVNDWLIKLLMGEEWTPESGWGDVGAKVWGAIKTGFGIASDWLIKLLLGEEEYTPDATWATVGEKIWDKILEGLSSAANWLQTLLTGWTEKLTDGSVDFESIGSSIWEAIKSAFSSVVGWFVKLFGGDDDSDEESVKGGILGIDWSGLGDSIWGLISAAFTGIAGIFKGWFEAAWNDIKDIDWAGLGESMWGAIKDAFGSVAGWFEDTFRAPVNTVIGYINSMITSFENAYNRIVNAINSVLGTNFEQRAFDRVQKLSSGNDYGGVGRTKKFAKGGILGEGQSAFVGEYAPELLRVIGGKAMVTPLSKVPARFPGGGQEMAVPRYTAPKNLNVVLKIKDTEIARVLLPLLDTEEQRVGLKLAKGGAY